MRGRRRAGSSGTGRGGNRDFFSEFRRRWAASAASGCGQLLPSPYCGPCDEASGCGAGEGRRHRALLGESGVSAGGHTVCAYFRVTPAKMVFLAKRRLRSQVGSCQKRICPTYGTKLPGDEQSLKGKLWSAGLLRNLLQGEDERYAGDHSMAFWGDKKDRLSFCNVLETPCSALPLPESSWSFEMKVKQQHGC